MHGGKGIQQCRFERLAHALPLIVQVHSSLHIVVRIPEECVHFPISHIWAEYRMQLLLWGASS